MASASFVSRPISPAHPIRLLYIGCRPVIPICTVNFHRVDCRPSTLLFPYVIAKLRIIDPVPIYTLTVGDIFGSLACNSSKGDIAMKIQKRLVGILIGIWVLFALYNTISTVLHNAFSADNWLWLGINLLTIFFALHIMWAYWSGGPNDPKVKAAAAEEMRRLTEPVRRMFAAFLTRWRGKSLSCEPEAIQNLAMDRTRAEAARVRQSGHPPKSRSKSKRKAGGTKSASPKRPRHPAD